MPIRTKEWTQVDGTIPNVRLVETEAKSSEACSVKWYYGTIGIAIGLLVGQLTHWIF